MASVHPSADGQENYLSHARAGNVSVAQASSGPNLQSFEKDPVPDWFRIAKSVIWAHWEPHYQPQQSDWYAS